MSAGRKRLLLILLGAAALLWIAGVASIPVVDALDPKIKIDNVILNGIPFIFIFIGIIVAFIDVIILVATRLNNNVSDNVYRAIERASIAGIVLGIVGMFQPFAVQLYTLGFILLLVSTLVFIFWSHIIPRIKIDRAKLPHEGLGSVSISELEKRDVQG